MDFMFVVIPLFIMGVAILVGVKTVLRALQLRSAWRSGLTAEARCLRFYTTTRRHDDHVTTTRHHVYEFTTRDGRLVRFEEENGPGTIIEGDIVPVHYTAEHPERATARPPSPVGNLAGTAGTLAFVAVMIAFCVFFMTTAASGPDF
ncbi:hypothetical protein P8605_09765 [Streptomyces sp. T-3]|nr:hypothetical protein [Streptomyces sp. T-3]